MSDNQEYFDKDGLVEYLDITISMYYGQKLWKKIPNTKMGKTRIFKKEVVDWYMMQSAVDEVEDVRIHRNYQKFLREKEKVGLVPSYSIGSYGMRKGEKL